MSLPPSGWYIDTHTRPVSMLGAVFRETLGATGLRGGLDTHTEGNSGASQRTRSTVRPKELTGERNMLRLEKKSVCKLLERSAVCPELNGAVTQEVPAGKQHSQILFFQQHLSDCNRKGGLGDWHQAGKVRGDCS